MLPACPHPAAAGGHADVEEDDFQKRIDQRLKPVEVDPSDRSIGAYFQRTK